MKRPTSVSRIWWMGSTLGNALMLAGCGGSDRAEGDTNAAAGGGSGTVTDTWAAYCTGTFTADTSVQGTFGEDMFTAHAGEEYLLTEYTETSAEFAYLTPVGPETFDIEPDASGAFPFTSNCEPNQGVVYYAVFVDVSVYAEETLTTKICDLTAGTALPAAGGARGYGTSLASSSRGNITYEVSLDAFSEQCGGAESGYVSVSQTEVFGTQTWLVPIISIIGPG